MTRANADADAASAETRDRIAILRDCFYNILHEKTQRGFAQHQRAIEFNVHLATTPARDDASEAGDIPKVHMPTWT